MRFVYRKWMVAFALVALAGCDDAIAPVGESSPRLDRETCDLPDEFFLSITNWDAIPSIEDPVFVDPESPFADYLAEDDRVIGLLVRGRAYAVPHNVLWHHEIVNFDTEIGPIAVTYCPLTGSSIAFNRTNADGEAFGVSGFLFKNNLVMFDRERPSSIWVQMQGDAACGPKRGTALTHWPVFEMRWESWLELHPSTRVLGQDQGDIGYDYTADAYPYFDYEQYSFDEFLYPNGMPELDRRRPVKERVLGVLESRDDPPVAFPFDALTGLDGRRQVISFEHGGRDAVVLWDDEARGGMAFRPRTGSGESIDLRTTGEGFVDQTSGSVFTVDGRARSGPLAGESLVPIAEAYVAFWGAWAAFNENTELWQAGGGS